MCHRAHALAARRARSEGGPAPAAEPRQQQQQQRNSALLMPGAQLTPMQKRAATRAAELRAEHRAMRSHLKSGDGAVGAASPPKAPSHGMAAPKPASGVLRPMTAAQAEGGGSNVLSGVRRPDAAARRELAALYDA